MFIPHTEKMAKSELHLLLWGHSEKKTMTGTEHVLPSLLVTARETESVGAGPPAGQTKHPVNEAPEGDVDKTCTGRANHKM